MANVKYRTCINQKSLMCFSNSKPMGIFSCAPALLHFIYIICLLVIIPPVHSKCPVIVQQERCDFSFGQRWTTWTDLNGSKADKRITSCVEQLPNKGHRTGYFIPEDHGQCGEGGCSPIAREHYCPLNLTFDDLRIWGICNGHCYDDEEEAKDFEDDPVSATFCKVKPSTCIFPFIYGNKTYESCIPRGDGFWCATKVNINGEAIKGFWGECDLGVGQNACDPTWAKRNEGIGVTNTIIIVVITIIVVFLILALAVWYKFKVHIYQYIVNPV